MEINHNIKLGILDNCFPNLKTGFRVAEFNWYLKNIPKSKVFVEKIDYINNIDEYLTFYPDNKDKIISFQDLEIDQFISELKHCDILYTIFIGNAFKYLNYFNLAQKPFVFTLYPGGGFLIDDPICDMMLREVFNNKYFSKVIVTQKITYDYLINNNFVEDDKIEFIYGVTTHSPSRNIPKKFYKKEKDTLDICFVAFKYNQDLKSKGYDIFAQVCNKISQIDEDIRFHVIGGYNEYDIDVSNAKDKLKFYGYKNQDFFEEFYSSMDIIISSTRPFTLYNKAFDGFPTTCCIDAALNGVLVFSTDQLNLNYWYEDNKIKNVFEDEKDICIINDNPDYIIQKILFYKNNINILYKLSENSKKRFNEVFYIENQMSKRLDVFEDIKGLENE